MGKTRMERRQAALATFWTAAVAAVLMGCVAFGFCLCQAMQIAAW